MKGVASGLALGAAVAALLVACSARSPQRSMAPASYEVQDLRKDEIRDLWMQIRTWRVEARLAADPPWPVIQHATRFAVADLRQCPSRPDPQTETCQDVCTLKDAICDNAASICQIAEELGGDPWADQKCESAKGSCREARDRCCTCVSREEPALDLDGASDDE